MTTLQVFIDGSCSGNPGQMGIGVDAGHAFEISKAVGYGTNNEAEYIALETAIDELRRRDIRNAVIHTDSQLLFNQVNGLWKVRSEVSQKYVPRIREKMAGFKLVWIPREQNKAADRLSAAATGVKR